MPQLTGVSVDPNLLPNFFDAYLLVDAAITPINTAVDIVTLGTLQPGTYLVSGDVTVNQITGASQVTARILQGAVAVKFVEALVAIGNQTIVIPLFELTLLAAAIVKMQAFSTVLTSTAKSIAPDNGTGSQNFVSSLTALRIA